MCGWWDCEVFIFKQKTAYDMRISDWSSDVCSSDLIRGQSLRGKVAGIIGIGSIGRATATRLHAMGMSLLGYDVAPVSSAFSVETGLRQVDLETLLGGSDLVILTCALTPENHHLLNEKTLREIKPGAMIVNVARGPLIKEAARDRKSVV